MWQGNVRVTFPLGSSGPKQSDERERGEKERKKERKKRKERVRKGGVRSSTFSLGFPEIEPSVLVGARGKLVHVTRATCGYQNQWFVKLQEVGVFLLLGFILGLRVI